MALGLVGSCGYGWGKDHPWVKAAFPDSPTTKSLVSKGICTTYGKCQICAHQTDPSQPIPPSHCAKVAAPADKEGCFFSLPNRYTIPVKKKKKKHIKCLFIISQPVETMVRKSACLDEAPSLLGQPGLEGETLTCATGQWLILHTELVLRNWAVFFVSEEHYLAERHSGVSQGHSVCETDWETAKWTY